MSEAPTSDAPKPDGAAAPEGARAAKPRSRTRARLRSRRRALSSAPPVRALKAGGRSSLTRRILFLNLIALLALLSGILYLNQFRQGLIDARVRSLLTQGEIIAGAIGAAATSENPEAVLEPEQLLGLETGPGAPDLALLEFPIDPERIAPVLQQLISPTRTRARIFDREGLLILDSRQLLTQGERFDVPPPAPEPVSLSPWERASIWLRAGNRPVYQEGVFVNGRDYEEVGTALSGTSATLERVNTRGELIVSVAVPVQRDGAVLGALLMSTEGGDIDAILTAERSAMLRVFVVAAAVTTILSLILASTIAGPMQRLADAADRVRRGVHTREEIPDYSHRTDEIGHLSAALRDMTASLYDRLDAIERFAADVAHELKNPLTSLRSAVETLPLARTAEQRGRLIEIVQHDVQRLDRLITDISAASRLDAELQRDQGEAVDLVDLAREIKELDDERREASPIPLRLGGALDETGEQPLPVRVQPGRFGQVLANLVDNARSFSPEGASVVLTGRRLRGEIEIAVEDDGPGISEENLSRVFERFYTDRPDGHAFGNNSGLGLSISRQIVEAYGGRIWAENRVDDEGAVSGARFVIRLPLHEPDG